MMTCIEFGDPMYFMLMKIFCYDQSMVVISSVFMNKMGRDVRDLG